MNLPPANNYIVVGFSKDADSPVTYYVQGPDGSKYGVDLCMSAAQAQRAAAPEDEGE